MFYVTGLRNIEWEWIAEYLGASNDLAVVNAPGYASPEVALRQDKLIASNPGARWVLIERAYSPAGGDHVLQGKLEELRLKVKPLVVPYGTLGCSIQDIALYVNSSAHNYEHHQSFIQSRPPIEEVPIVTEPIVLSDTCQEYLAAVKELCRDEFAFVFMRQLIDAALVWDHYSDGDALDPAMMDRTMLALMTEWPINPFLKKYSECLVPVLVGAISAWKHSYNGGVSKDLAYEVYATTPAAIAFILGGNDRVNEHMPKIRELVTKMKDEDSLRDGGKL